MKIMTVLGTRPEAIKLAPVLLALQARAEVRSMLCVTGQHREMLDPMLELFGLHVDRDLALMQTAQSLTHITQAVLAGMAQAIEEDRPDWLIVQGDTTSAMAAALAAFYARVPVAHVEAGLRTYDPLAPWPEEINRRLISPIAALHFAPTEPAAEHLRREGLPPQDVLVTGNTVIDALHWVLARPGGDEALDGWLQQHAPALRACPRRLLLVTLHRRESLGAPLAGLCEALRSLAARGDVEVAFPVHLNPQVQGVVHGKLAGVDGVHLLPPLQYQHFVALLQRCHLVLTDSGGLQEEAAALGKPVVVAREHTERTEAIAAGTAVLAGTTGAAVLQACNGLLDDAARWQRMALARNPFGDGHAAERIVRALLHRGAG